MFSIERISKRFRAGNFGVRDLPLEAKSGVIGLLGPNGAGKTTLMRMIATITRPTSGRILFHGTDITQRLTSCGAGSVTCRRIFGVYDNLTAPELLRYFAALKGRSAGGGDDCSLNSSAAPMPAPPRVLQLTHLWHVEDADFFRWIFHRPDQGLDHLVDRDQSQPLR